ncbi:MAG TPA: hypothetical protein VGQ58_02600 [Candidatus Limnocylindrales bacterium]|jgi:hypothetical protein|nr:hypothetical protein [Candidatus Limnocylindrales bacterium]
MSNPAPEFEEIPTVRIGRAADRRRTHVAVLVAVVALAAAILKPWGDGPARQAAIRASPPPARSTVPFDRSAPRGYDPDLFGHYEQKPAWELWPAGYVYQFGISGPLSLDETGASPPAGGPPPSGPADSPGPPPVRPSPSPAPPPGAGELVDVGAADHLVVLALNTPAGTRVLDARLWMFPAGESPSRLPLVELPPPWPVDYFHVYGIPVRDDPAELAAWRPGLYRLDILVDPGIAVRRIGVLVRPPLEARSAKDRPAGAGPTGPSRPLDPDQAGARVAVRMIGFGVPAGGLWAIEIPEPQAPCGLAELWLAEADRPGGRCGAIVVEQASVVTLNLGSEQPIRTINIDQVDPVPGPVAIVLLPEPAYSGMVVATTDGDVLGSGTYRVTATLVNGESLGWYIRVP